MKYANQKTQETERMKQGIAHFYRNGCPICEIENRMRLLPCPHSDRDRYRAMTILFSLMEEARCEVLTDFVLADLEISPRLAGDIVDMFYKRIRADRDMKRRLEVWIAEEDAKTAPIQ